MDHDWFVGSVHMPDLAKPEGYKLILLFLEQKGYKKDALDKRLLANRRYEAVARRPGQTLQDFFATEKMAFADAVKTGVGIDPDRRAMPNELYLLNLFPMIQNRLLKKTPFSFQFLAFLDGNWCSLTIQDQICVPSRVQPFGSEDEPFRSRV